MIEYINVQGGEGCNRISEEHPQGRSQQLRAVVVAAALDSPVVECGGEKKEEEEE